jgi:hypothetical protein
MQARCPHCSTVFNTERAGVQFCPNCGQQINVPDPAGAGGMPPPPPGAPGAPSLPPGPAALNRGPVPWEERGQRGVFGAFFENWKMIFMQPEQFWGRMRPEGALTDALFFGWICFAINGLLNIPMQLVSAAINRGQMDQILQGTKDLPPEARRIANQFISTFMGGGAVGVVIGQIILYPVILIITTAILHLFCLICGASKNGFNATARVVGYAQAPYLLGWIPCCGGLLAPIYTLVLQCWGIARAQDTTVGRAVLATVVIPILLFCCCVGGFIALAGALGASGAAAQ